MSDSNRPFLSIKKRRKPRAEHLSQLQLSIIRSDYSGFIDALGNYIKDYYTVDEICNFSGYGPTIVKSVLEKKHLPDFTMLTYLLEAVNIKLLIEIEFKEYKTRELSREDASNIRSLLDKVTNDK